MDPRGERLRRLLAAFADQVEPGEGLPAIRTRTAQRRPWWRRLATRTRADAPGWTPGAPRPTAEQEPKDMETLQRQAQQLQPGDIITAHPDHPEREVWYRVASWPHRIAPTPELPASVLVDYTCRAERLDGDTSGVLMLPVDQPCTVVPAHACGGAR